VTGTDVTVLEIKRDNQPVKRARGTVSAVLSEMRMASGKRVKPSTAVSQFV
jgi:hypothetical protein